ncbi:MAG: S1 RNA-binding domain-containing protein [Oscillospiraceae bacterium]|jgi:S1 RNA binding domain protein|nr:S1 RNA-binding domain-containing protein [Oscillospiraceae bacterium]
MDYTIGSILTGTVATITKYGAFVNLPGGRSGLVHISEIAATYVNDVREHLTEGQEVTVKLLSLDKDGRLNLSIKKALPPQPHGGREKGPHNAGAGRSAGRSAAPQSFEDKLKAFMSDSENKQSDLHRHSDRRSAHRKK